MIAGLGISFARTILVAFSIKRGKVKIKKDPGDKREHAIDFKQGRFRWGVGLLALGFLLQVVSVALG